MSDAQKCVGALTRDLLCASEASVNKTGRLLVSHEAPITSGFGAEITATIANKCETV